VVCWFWKDVGKIQKFPQCGLQDISVWIDTISFFGFAKSDVAALHKVTFVWKNVPNGGALLDSFFRQVGYISLKIQKLQIIWNCTTYRKKIVGRKKQKMVQNTKLLRI